MIKEGYLIIGPNNDQNILWFSEELEGPGGAIETAKELALKHGGNFNVISYDLEAIVKKEESQVSVTEISTRLLLAPKCMYCRKSAFYTDPGMFLMRVNAPGYYWQHWDFKKNIGCAENKTNSAP